MGELGGRFALEEEVGSGGFGTVYRAHQRDLARTVAIKLLHTTEPDVVERFRREARTAAQLAHPNIVPIYEVGEDRGRPFLVMRYVEGQTLDRLRVDARRALEIVRDAALAVHHAHEQGIVHRDLKPSNLMVDRAGHVWVMDFGLARPIRRGTTLTIPGAILGTPAYMPPEQAAGGACDARSDVYSLGATLYELVTGRPPFEGDTPFDILLAVLQKEPPAPRGAPRDVGIILSRAMDKTPARRYPSARALAEDLRRHLEGEAILARPPALPVRVVRWMRRHRAASLTAALLLAAAAALGVRSLSRMIEIRELERRAERAARSAEVEAEQTAMTALRLDPDCAEAKRFLAEFYFRRWEREPALYEPLVERYGGPEFAARLREPGILDLDLEGHLFRYVERAGRLIPMPCSAAGEAREIEPPVDPGNEPAPPECSEFNRVRFPVRLPPGSYLVVARGVRIPALVERGRTLRAKVGIPDEVPDGFVWIPGGPAILGGDPTAPNYAGERVEGRVEVAGFFLARFEVTCREYLEFLNDRAWHSVEAALRRSPRPSSDAPPYWKAEGDRVVLGWPFDRPSLPVLAVSQSDAEEYASWRSRGRWTYRLPTESEWEKAARGVDGRLFVWGNRFEPGFCLYRDARPELTNPEPVGAFPGDESPYGIRDLAGSAMEWTSTPGCHRREFRVVKGGSWGGLPALARAATRFEADAGFVDVNSGFRLAADAKP